MRETTLIRLGSATYWTTLDAPEVKVREMRISPRCYRDGVVCGFYSGCAAGFMFALSFMAAVAVLSKY